MKRMKTSLPLAAAVAALGIMGATTSWAATVDTGNSSTNVANPIVAAVSEDIGASAIKAIPCDETVGFKGEEMAAVTKNGAIGSSGVGKAFELATPILFVSVPTKGATDQNLRFDVSSGPSLPTASTADMTDVSVVAVERILSDAGPRA